MEKITVRGRLTDFDGNPLEGGDVIFNDANFNKLFASKTDEFGEFAIEVDDRIYPSVFICKDYKTKFLEYWHWNFKPKTNENLEIKIDGLELYGLHAWEARPTYPGLTVFFRPMSLHRYKSIGEPDKNTPILIAPNLEVSDIKVTIDSKIAPVLGLNKVKEFISETQYLDAYTVHVSLEGIEGQIKRICLQVTDQETSERGMACVDLN